MKFRETFKARFLKGFIIPAWTFDNVNGDFPIGFLVWNLGDKKDIKKCRVNIFNENNKRIGKKNFYANLPQSINQWIATFNGETQKAENTIGWLGTGAPDFQNQKYICLLSQKGTRNVPYIAINKYNLTQSCVYFAARMAIKHFWINDRDQFLYPKNKWRDDSEFHSDCLAFTLFHGQNRISANSSNTSPSPAEGDKGGGYSGHINHFIPFSESQVGAKEAFKSDFMVRFINGKVKNGALEDCFIPSQKIEFSLESQAVFKAGLEIWRYYHECAKNSDSYLNDASLYDIKDFFQGRGESINGKKGKMNAKSDDSHYNDLIAQLRIALQTLADKIAPKIYEYEFLRE